MTSGAPSYGPIPGTRQAAEFRPGRPRAAIMTATGGPAGSKPPGPTRTGRSADPSPGSVGPARHCWGTMSHGSSRHPAGSLPGAYYRSVDLDKCSQIPGSASLETSMPFDVATAMLEQWLMHHYAPIDRFPDPPTLANVRPMIRALYTDADGRLIAETRLNLIAPTQDPARLLGDRRRDPR